MKSVVIYFPNGNTAFVAKGEKGFINEEPVVIKSFTVTKGVVKVTYSNKKKIEYIGFPISIEH